MKKEIVCKLGKKIVLTEERIIHMIFRHPEMQKLENEIINSLKNPYMIKKTVYDKNVIIYYGRLNQREFVAVVVKILNGNGFVLTSYVTDFIKEGEIIWKTK